MPIKAVAPGKPVAPAAPPVAAPKVRRPFDPIISVTKAAEANKAAAAPNIPKHIKPAMMMGEISSTPPADPINVRPLPGLADFFAPETFETPQPSVQLAGDLAAGARKVPVRTYVGNFTDKEISLPFFSVPKLTKGDTTNSWFNGTGFFVANGDLVSGKDHRSGPRRRGTMMATALNDDVRSLAVIGRDWREVQLLNTTIYPTNSLTMVPARDTHRIFIFKDTASVAFNFNLATTGLLPGMRFKFVNLSAAETAGTNEQQTITISATGGTFTISFGGYTTSALAYNASASTVQAALEALASIGANNILVGLGGSVYTLTFRNALGNTNVAAVTTDATLLTGGAGTAVVATTVPGVAAIGQLVVVANGATIAGSSINRLTLSRGAVLVLEAVPTSLVASFGYQYIIRHKLGTIA